MPAPPDDLLRDALRHHQSGALGQAEAIYRQILSRDARHADALHLLGALCAQTNRTAEAVEHLTQAVAVRPAFPEAHYNRGHALAAAGRGEEAIAAYRQAIAQRPAFPEALNNLGGLLRDRRQLAEAIDACRRAIDLRPDYPEALVNLGSALHASGALDDALAAARRAIALRPAYAEAHHLLAHVLSDLGRLDESLAACKQALAIRPAYAEVFALLGHVLKDVGRIDDAIAASRMAIALRPADAAAHSNLLLTLHFHPGSTPASLAAEHREWKRRHAASIPHVTSHANDRDPDRRLRVAYVSPDFRRHPIGRFLLPLLAHHDRERVEVICYDNAPRADDVTARLRAHADAWRPITALDDDAAARLIRDDRVDVLVDLTMHAARNRLLVFARRPAPVQATWLAYCSTTGLDAIDYRLSDPYFDPPGTQYAEHTIRLPRTYWCYPAPDEAGDVGPPPALAAGHVTFGCLNGFAKVSDPALAMWARVLRKMPGSRLLLHAPEGGARRRVLSIFDRAGVTSDRVAFVARMSTVDYFARYGEIDVALDPFPYAGGTTTCDALWMGVPVVTLAGATGVGRAGVSVLTNVGLPELIATSEDEYVRIAATLASDLPRLTSLRASMRSRMGNSPLMDAVAFARDIELAFRQMWRAWCSR